MKILFILDTQMILENQIIEKVYGKEPLAVIYFKNIGLSKDFAMNFVKTHNVLFLSDIGLFFKKMKNDTYSFSLAMYTVHITKDYKNIISSITPFASNIETMYDFLIKNTKIDSWLFRLLYSELNVWVSLYYINLFFWPLLIISIIVCLSLSYFLFFPQVDLNRKKMIYEFFFKS